MAKHSAHGGGVANRTDGPGNGTESPLSADSAVTGCVDFALLVAAATNSVQLWAADTGPLDGRQRPGGPTTGRVLRYLKRLSDNFNEVIWVQSKMSHRAPTWSGMAATRGFTRLPECACSGLAERRGSGHDVQLPVGWESDHDRLRSA